MTGIGTQIAAVVAALAGTTGGLVGAAASEDGSPAPRSAIVIDAGEARDGRDLVDARLRDVDAEVRLPRTPTEARRNVRYLAAQGYDVVVAGADAREAATATGIAAERATGLAAALTAIER